MRSFILVCLVCAGAIAAYVWHHPQALAQVQSQLSATLLPQQEPLYKWIDKNGQPSYGAHPPKGVHATPLDPTHGNVNVMPATKTPVPIPSGSEAQSDPRSISERTMERAIEQSAR